MSEPPYLPPSKAKSTILVVWAIGATVVALVSTGLAGFFYLKARHPVVPPTTSPAAASFPDLSESAIPGDYKWISKSGSESFITLNADRTFSKGGTTHPQHRWELTRDALVINWLRSQNRLNKMERPGIFIEVKDGIEITRMERQQ